MEHDEEVEEVEGPFELESHKPNPLLIHTVVNAIFQNFTPTELKPCRLVCKSWNEELSKTLKKASQVFLLTNRRLSEFLSESIRNHEFCSKYKLGSEITIDLHEERQSLTWTFFHIFGPFIKTLYLDNSKWSKEVLLNILYHQCPNLEEFSVVATEVEGGLFSFAHGDDDKSGSDSDSSGDIEYDPFDPMPIPSCSSSSASVPTSASIPLNKIRSLRVNLTCSRMRRNTKIMADLLKISPNVTTISWIDTYLDEVRYDRNFQLDLERAWGATPHDRGITIRDTICDTAIHQKEISLSSLSRIESNMRLNNESIQVLEKRNFPLSFLDLSLNIDVEPSTLTSVLMSLSSTLVALRLEFYPTHGAANFPNYIFPTMPNLQHLFVQRFPTSFSFCKNFNDNRLPRLKSLTFCETEFKAMIGGEDIWPKYVRGGCARSKNESLRIFQVSCDLSRRAFDNDDVEGLAHFLPNLKEVRIENFDRLDKTLWETSFPKVQFFGPPSNKGLGGLPTPKGES